MNLTSRETLINRIQEYDRQIQVYRDDDSTKPHEELNVLSDAELEAWLNLRTLRLQSLIEEDIEKTRNECGFKP